MLRFFPGCASMRAYQTLLSQYLEKQPDTFSPNLQHWCILRWNERIRFGGQKVKVQGHGWTTNMNSMAASSAGRLRRDNVTLPTCWPQNLISPSLSQDATMIEVWSSDTGDNAEAYSFRHTDAQKHKQTSARGGGDLNNIKVLKY